MVIGTGPLPCGPEMIGYMLSVYVHFFQRIEYSGSPVSLTVFSCE